MSSDGRGTAPEYQRNDKQDQKNDEKHLRNPGGRSRDATESEDPGDQGNDQEYETVSKHWISSFA